jgi:hypothetical protein
MEQSPSWEANWSAGSQEIPHILWNPKVHRRRGSNKREMLDRLQIIIPNSLCF